MRKTVHNQEVSQLKRDKIWNLTSTIQPYNSGFIQFWKSGNQCGRGVGMLSGYHSVWTKTDDSKLMGFGFFYGGEIYYELNDGAHFSI